jgi:2-C-methyl-D-erythritol 4-phosphate cytidylyltransferase/2-C-methyl-D-erythritol 2,4-cyclodiphosphate synthase
MCVLLILSIIIKKKINKLYNFSHNMNSKQTRVGMGFDAHRFLPTQNGPLNKIMLCGIEIPSTYDIEANSDGDVGLHALVDALLGSVAAGDIGMHFTPNDPQWTGAKSSIFLKHALKIVHEKGGELVNIDITIITEKPYVSPCRQVMREKLSELLALDIDRVSIKATTTEKMGFLGREEGIAAQAIVSVLV